MKNMKRIFALVLALTMVLSLAVTASAATVTIPDNLSGHSFVAYQIFSGREENGVLSDVEWGDGIDSAAFVAELKTAFPEVFTAETYTAKEVAEELADFTDAQAKTVAQLAYECKKGNGTALQAGEENDLDDGYYLIVDANIGAENDDIKAYNAALLQITSDITITVKTDAPEVEKKVKDTNDTTNETTNWQDSADYDIGDHVPFQLTAKLPNNVTDYASAYKIVFHDSLSTGLTYDENSVKVYVGGNEVASDKYQVVTTGLTDGCNLEVVIADVEAAGATNSSVITVEYTATLNENAVLSNENTVKLEYSNNPNWVPTDADGDGTPDEEGPTDETPEDKVIVFTYKVVVNKVVKNPNYDASVEGSQEFIPLEGAGFTLYKKDAEGNWVEVDDGDEDEDNEISGDALTTFTWSGLDDGDYKLVETTTPAGYNTIPAIEFTITAEHEVESDAPKLTKLEGGDKFTGEVSTGTLTADIENKAGATLPETGGIGTTMFYIFGGILVLAAVVLLVTKKRMSSAE